MNVNKKMCSKPAAGLGLQKGNGGRSTKRTEYFCYFLPFILVCILFFMHLYL